MAQLNNCTVSLTGEIVNKKRSRQNVSSFYDGTAGRHFFMMLGTALLSIIPFVGLPNALCIQNRWNCRHTQIVGMRLRFEGRAGNLLGRLFVWGFFSVITLGIYALVLAPVRYKQWVAEHTIFEAVAQ